MATENAALGSHSLLCRLGELLELESCFSKITWKSCRCQGTFGATASPESANFPRKNRFLQSSGPTQTYAQLSFGTNHGSQGGLGSQGGVGSQELRLITKFRIKATVLKVLQARQVFSARYAFPGSVGGPSWVSLFGPPNWVKRFTAYSRSRDTLSLLNSKRLSLQFVSLHFTRLCSCLLVKDFESV